MLSQRKKVLPEISKIGLDKITLLSFLYFDLKEKELSKNLTQIPEKEEILKVIKRAKQLKALCNSQQIKKLPPLKKIQSLFRERTSNNLRIMFFAIAKDIRAIFLLILDNWFFLKKIKEIPKNEKERLSSLALKILSPLCYGLGIEKIKSEIEDKAFEILYPKEFFLVKEIIKSDLEKRRSFLEKLKPKVAHFLKKEKIKLLDIRFRAKHYFSIYQKLLTHQLDPEKIYDLVAMRIIVNKISDCYQTLGALHKYYFPVAGRIKDYIACPKQSGYRALHTTLLCENNQKVEFQIKTLQMEKEADYGICASLKYKTKISSKIYRNQFYWLEKLRQWQKEIRDLKKVSELLKNFDLFKERIFVFTPKGDIIDLPKKSTPVDFAYAIHSEIGDHCQGAKINGKLTSLDSQLKTGDQVEILIDKNKTPSIDWLRFVKTEKARSKIKSFFQNLYGISFQSSKKIVKRKKLFKRVFSKRKESFILIGGEKKIYYRIAKCCKPKPTETILAFVSHTAVASVHKKDCPNLKELSQKWPQRIIKASWESREIIEKKSKKNKIKED